MQKVSRAVSLVYGVMDDRDTPANRLYHRVKRNDRACVPAIKLLSFVKHRSRKPLTYKGLLDLLLIPTRS